MQSSNSLSVLYEEVGRALGKAQMVEYNLVSVMILLSKIEVSKPKEVKSDYWLKKQMGWLLKPIIESDLISEDIKDFLQTVINARNHLAHNFFMEGDISTEEGVSRSILEIKAMQDVFDRAFALVENVLANLAKKEFFIDIEEIKKEAAKEMKFLIS